VNGQPIQKINSPKGSKTVKSHQIWDVEYCKGLVSNKVAIDSMNDIILIGVGGEGYTELPYAVVAKYGADGKLKWADHRTARILPGSVSQVYAESYPMYKYTEIYSTKQTLSSTPATEQSQIDTETSECKMTGNQYVTATFSENQRLFGGKWVRFYDVAIDENDNIVAVGEIQNRNTADKRIVYVVKYDSDGNVLWDRTYKRYCFGSRDVAMGVAIDSEDNIFVTVRSQEKDSEAYRGWILKLSSNNGAKISQSLYPDSSVIFSDIAVDSDDNLYVSVYYDTSGKMNVAKYSNDLNLLDEWGPAIRPIRPIAITVDQSDNVIVAGGIGYYGSEKQYLMKFSPDGTLLWSNKSKDIGVWYDVIAISPDVTAATGISWADEVYGKFYVGLYNESGKEFKRLLAGHKTNLQCFFSYGLDLDSNGDIVVAGFRWYGGALYFMHAMKFYL